MGDNKKPKRLTTIKSCPTVGFTPFEKMVRVDLPRIWIEPGIPASGHDVANQPPRPAGRGAGPTGIRGRWADAAYVEDPGVALLGVTGLPDGRFTWARSI